MGKAAGFVWALAALGAVVIGGTLLVDFYGEKWELEDAQRTVAEQGRQIESLQGEVARQTAELAVKDHQIDQLGTEIKLLTVRHRIAKITVVDQFQDPATNELTSVVQFVEVDDEGVPLEAQPRVFEFKGGEIYVEYLVIRFQDDLVRNGRRKAICLFRRVYSNEMRPTDGFTIDKVSSRPTAYARGAAMSDHERELWDNFWSIANDTRAAEERGVDSAQGISASMKLEPGKVYTLIIDATGGVSLKPDVPEAAATAPVI